MFDGSSAIALPYIDGIPWDRCPAFSADENVHAYLDSFANVLDILPETGQRIRFWDDVWDFNPYYNRVNSPQLKFYFSDIPNDLSVYCKFFVLKKIQGSSKISTVNIRYSDFRSIICSIIMRTPKNYGSITTGDLVEEILRRNATSARNYSLLQSIHQVYDFLIKFYGLDLPVDLSLIENEMRKWSSITLQHNNKLPNIPVHYFDSILKTALNVMRDVSAHSDMRMVAASLVILSQTGFRLGDLLALTIDSLFSKTLIASGESVHYFHYTAQKPTRAHQDLLEFDVFCNSLAAEAFEIMKDLRVMSPLSQGNSFLCVFSLPHRCNSVTEMPHTRTRFNSLYQKFMYTYLPAESTMVWDGISPTKYRVRHSPEPIALYIPDTRQYRVYCCTDLYNKGCPLEYIKRYMGHLTESMMGYYVRPKDTYQENIAYAEQLIHEIAADDLRLLGNAAMGAELKQFILNFIQEKNFNVQNDIHDIVQAMGSDIAIRAKTGGVCIKAWRIPCIDDASTNKLLCAHNLCPNIYHFYYMADLSYLDFKTLQETYHVLTAAGKIKAAQKELSKMRDVLNRRLIPELDELESEIERQGVDSILARHPCLLEIIENLYNIRREVEEWKMRR